MISKHHFQLPIFHIHGREVYMAIVCTTFFAKLLCFRIRRCVQSLQWWREVRYDHALNRFESEDVARYRWRTWHLWYWSSAGTKDKRYNLRRNYGAPSMPNRNLRSRRTIFFNVIRSDSLRNVKIVNYLECASQIVHCPHPARIPVL